MPSHSSKLKETRFRHMRCTEAVKNRLNLGCVWLPFLKTVFTFEKLKIEKLVWLAETAFS